MDTVWSRQLGCFRNVSSSFRWRITRWHSPRFRHRAHRGVDGMFCEALSVPQLLGGSKAARTLSMPLGALIPVNWGVGPSLVWLALSSRRRKDLEKGGFLRPGAVGGGFLKEGSEGRNGGYSLAGDRKDDLPAGQGQAGIRSFGPRGRCWRVCSVILKHCSHSRACDKDPVFERERWGTRGRLAG